MDTFITLSPAGSYAGKGAYYPVIIKLFGNATYGPAGSGGWQVVDRPKSTAATQWFDRSPFQMQFEGVLDGENREAGGQRGNYIPYMAGEGYGIGSYGRLTGIGWSAVNSYLSGTENVTSVENDCKQIESWLKAVPGLLQPPVFNVSGPVPGTEKYWVLFNVEFTDAIRDFNTGMRTLQNVRITLYEYVPPLGRGYTLFGLTPASEFISNTGTGGGTTQTTRTYVVKKGDTLQKIANSHRKKLTQYAFVAAIKNLNKIRDNGQLATLVGKKIKLPVG